MRHPTRLLFVALLSIAAGLAPIASVPPAASAAGTDADRLTVRVTWAPGLIDTVDAGVRSARRHPPERPACLRALSAIALPFAKEPAGVACTMVYGGPETARVTGRWQGARVATSFSRTDGCGIARWEQYRALLSDPTTVIVRGRVDLGPTCPVVRPGESCEIIGVPATVTATSGTRSRQATSGTDGFALRLPRRVWSSPPTPACTARASGSICGPDGRRMTSSSAATPASAERPT